MSSQDNMPPLEANSPIEIGLEKDNSAETQDKDFKTAIMNMFKDFKGDINKYLSKKHENIVE